MNVETVELRPDPQPRIGLLIRSIHPRLAMTAQI
jgi:hypothetical protein